MNGDTVTSICNRALQEIGTRTTIQSLTEGSNESNNCSLAYDPARMQLLRAANWNFTRADISLSLLLAAPGTPENPTLPINPMWIQGQMPPLPWLYEYAYPSDCARARQIKGQSLSTFPGVPLFPVPSGPGISAGWGSPAMKFAVGTDLDAFNNPRTVILTNIENAILTYTRDISNTAVFDAQFCEALVFALAGKLALALTGDKALAQLKFQMANAYIIQARKDDGNEGVTSVNHTPDWIRTRGFGSDWTFNGPFSFEAPFGPLFGGVPF